MLPCATVYLNINVFGYPAAFTQGNIGTDSATFGDMWLPQHSLAKTIGFRERYPLTVRMDSNRLFPVFTTVQLFNTADNLTSPALLGKNSFSAR
jgi:hypothetical protein